MRLLTVRRDEVSYDATGRIADFYPLARIRGGRHGYLFSVQNGLRRSVGTAAWATLLIIRYFTPFLNPGVNGAGSITSGKPSPSLSRRYSRSRPYASRTLVRALEMM